MKTTYFLIKVVDVGIESSIEGIENATPEQLREVNIDARAFIDSDTLKIYLSSNANIPSGCHIELQFLCESTQ